MSSENLSLTDASCNPTVADRNSPLTPHEHALAYAWRGLPVFPAHSLRDGRCTCGDAECKTPGKHPRTINGVKDATTNAAQIERWWSQWPDANIGIATDDLTVVDVDVSNGKPGEASLRALEAKHGPLPQTFKVKTGSGGWHYYFRGAGRNSAGKLGPGIDTRGTGGYVIAPPSVHVSGGRYELEAVAPARDPIAPVPEWIAAALRTKTLHASAALDAEFELTREHCLEQVRSLSRKTSVAAQRERKLWRDLADGVPLCERDRGRAHNHGLYVTLIVAKAYPTASPESVCKLLSPTWGEDEATEIAKEFTGARNLLAAESDEITAKIQTYESAGLALGDQGKVLPTPANVLKIARMPGKGLAGCLRINVRGQLLECRALPWDSSDRWREWTDSDDMRLAEWLQDAWEIFVGPERTRAPIATAAAVCEVDPFLEWLQSLAQWDGTPRVETWLTRTFGGESTSYTRAISQKFLLSAIARTYLPGCKADTKPVLVGPQGYLKSTALRTLVGSEFFTDAASDPNEAIKDRLARYHRAVLIEDQEMSTHTRADVNADKAFLSTSVDVFRPPYGHSTGSYPRRFVLCGTSNESDGFLHDVTGGRRYWPFRCEQRADIEWLSANRDQLWAEALQVWSDESRRVWWLSSEEEIAAAAVQEEHRASLPYEDSLRERLSDPAVLASHGYVFGRVRNSLRDGRVQALTTDAALAILSVDEARREQEKPKIGRALRALGFKPKGQQKPRRYVTPDYRSSVPPEVAP
jgi:predicted P-loop ATPase